VFKLKLDTPFAIKVNMSNKDLERFCQLVLHEPALQNELKNISEREEFMKKLCELAAASGFEVLRADIERQMLENRRQWSERWI
jgi:hypothetical protein